MHGPIKPDAPYLLLIVKGVIPKEEGMSEEAWLHKVLLACEGLKKRIVRGPHAGCFKNGTHFTYPNSQHVWKPAYIDELLTLYTSYGNKAEKVAWVTAFKKTDDYKAIKAAAATEATEATEAEGV